MLQSPHTSHVVALLFSNGSLTLAGYNCQLHRLDPLDVLLFLVSSSLLLADECVTWTQLPDWLEQHLVH